MKAGLRFGVALASVATGLGFALLAWLMRVWGNYPVCQNDEVNWIEIAKQLDQGHPWPVSGPAFILTVRELSAHLGSRHEQSIAWLGVVGVFWVVIMLLWGYRKVALSGPAATLGTLALSSYFWAPLIEARPQQWGQVLVFLGTIHCWLWLNRRGGWGFFVVLPVIAATHILSHGILLWLCGVLVLADYFENRPITRRHLVVMMAMLFSLAVYWWPGGPYAAMLRDVQGNHLRRLLLLTPQIGGALLFIVVAIISMQRQWHWRPSWSSALAQAVMQRKTAMRMSILAAIVTMLAMQATILPVDAWLPYGGSVGLFLLYQTGNLLFAVFLAAGLHHFVEGVLDKSLDSVMGRMLIWVLVALALLSVVAVGASWWLLDTNWFLRVINYGLLFAAIVAAMGMHRALAIRMASMVRALIMVGILMSLIFVLRPPALIGC